MPVITLRQAAVEKLAEDFKLRRWNAEDSGRRVPFLRYFGRSYTTSHDGTVTERGDGFTLTTIDPTDAKETKGIVMESVAITNGVHILVGGHTSMMSRSFIIGWSKWKFTYEPQASQ